MAPQWCFETCVAQCTAQLQNLRRGADGYTCRGRPPRDKVRVGRTITNSMAQSVRGSSVSAVTFIVRFAKVLFPIRKGFLCPILCSN